MRNRLSLCEHSTPLHHVAAVRPYLRAVLTLAFKNLPHALSLLLKLEHKFIICSFSIELSVHSYNAAMLRSPCRAGYNMCTTNLPLQQSERSAPSSPLSLAATPTSATAAKTSGGRREGGLAGQHSSHRTDRGLSDVQMAAAARVALQDNVLRITLLDGLNNWALRQVFLLVEDAVGC